jgi:N-alpha-acetyltransferase 35, NatC auxiliary subunit
MPGYQEIPEDLLITRLPDVALLWLVREVILSGFQLELYSRREEKPFAYWYAVEVIDTRLNCLDNLTSVVPQGTYYHDVFWFCVQWD